MREHFAGRCCQEESVRKTEAAAARMGEVGLTLRTSLTNSYEPTMNASMHEGCMYIFGGVKDLSENIRTERINKVWLGVARLRDMCWEALCHYCPNLPSQPPSALLAMGIPPYIVEALQHQTPAYG
ncbi:Kelch domain-containing protein 10 [Chionoecetes opilio]|uniref:Kelch domain-containing protein 10 n=1 Tax=Chionoecetes opilio TaxID=41210 RepID=A0A8J5CM80_CHIOP|nr:Kelch domain-containing protein 10 [Chionoecetes opilio]